MELKAGESNNEDLLSSSGVPSNGGVCSLSNEMGTLELNSLHNIYSGCCFLVYFGFNCRAQMVVMNVYWKFYFLRQKLFSLLKIVYLFFSKCLRYFFGLKIVSMLRDYKVFHVSLTPSLPWSTWSQIPASVWPFFHSPPHPSGALSGVGGGSESSLPSPSLLTWFRPLPLRLNPSQSKARGSWQENGNRCDK